MSLEKTLSIIKPDAVKRNLTGKIIAMFEEKGLCVVAQKFSCQKYKLVFFVLSKEKHF